MPELPEVETVTRSLKGLEGKIIYSFVPFRLNLRTNLPSKQDLEGLKIQKIYRRSKFVVIETVMSENVETDQYSSSLSSFYLLIHLGMSGYLHWEEKGTPLLKHDHWEMEFNDDTPEAKQKMVLRYNDPRRFGLLEKKTEGELKAYLSKLGVEPLSKDFDPPYLYQALRHKKTLIKPAVMATDIVVGVGNIYATEALFLSGIHPKSVASDLTKKQCEVLTENIRQVLNLGILAGGATLKDYRKPDGKEGDFKNYIKTYGRQGQTCVQCQTPLLHEVIGGRMTVWCPSCQKINKQPISKHKK